MSQLKILKNTSHGGGHRTISSMKEGSRSKILAHSWRDHRDVGVIGAGEVVHPSREILQPTKTLLIDNYDSYTYNLYQSLAVVNGGDFSSSFAILSQPSHNPVTLSL